MSEATRKTGKLVEYDAVKKWGWIEYDEDEDKVYLAPAEAEGLELEEECEVTFTIKMTGSTPQAVGVKLK
ncbi:hypothetical protein [Pseudomonas maumuensis]|uniref:Cold shock protein (Beta-ribbon, CspA family) n=1 Tax=Pseudomonas maumuensis TaxID=2842354 RepID=A0ABX8NGU0_9PSED|nr:hypothetical protein [Pseudomonas maumuensis]QXH55643.1 hypothetical protein KSS90_20255 [Pseudomonas maumuensis]